MRLARILLVITLLAPFTGACSNPAWMASETATGARQASGDRRVAKWGKETIAVIFAQCLARAPRPQEFSALRDLDGRSDDLIHVICVSPEAERARVIRDAFRDCLGRDAVDGEVALWRGETGDLRSRICASAGATQHGPTPTRAAGNPPPGSETLTPQEPQQALVSAAKPGG